MTSSRVVRGTKGRIILCIFILIAITVIIACFNNILSQLDDTKKAYDQCHQQQENLSTQLQVIFDYKQRLEKSLKTEKAEHQQSKKDLESKIDEEKSHYEKVVNEVNLKFSSLQQHYNLLQTEYDDFKEESSKIQQQQINEIDDFKLKLKEVQGQLKQSISDKENSFEALKSKYLQLQTEKENVEKQIKSTHSNNLQSENEINHLTKLNHELQRELQNLKSKFSLSSKSSKPKQSIDIVTNTSDHNESINLPNRTETTNGINPKHLPNNVADLPLNADDVQISAEIFDAPKTDKQINPNEEFNNNENVLAPPNNPVVQLIYQRINTTSSSINKKSISKASLDNVLPLHSPTTTSSKASHKPSEESHVINHDPHVLPPPYANKKLPEGVVPVPDTPLEMNEESKGDIHKGEHEEKDIRDDINNAFPNRYRSNLIQNEIANENKAMEADKQEQINEHKDSKHNNLKVDEGDKENNALEIFDAPAHNDRGLEGDPFGLDDNHNDKINVKHPQIKPHKHVHNLQIEGAKLHDGLAHKVYDGQDDANYDKEVQNDMQLEETDPEAEDDDPDYADPIARQKDPAVRN